MRNRKTIAVTALAVGSLGIAMLVLPRASAQQRRPGPPPPGASAPASVRAEGVKFGEASFRATAIKAPMPQYPASSLANKTGGVAVVAVRAGFEGRVEQVDILEAPDPAIGEAVRRAVMEWTFKPARVGTAPEPWKARGKLTFYFTPEGKGRVSNPADAPAAGPRPAEPESAIAEISEADVTRRARDGGTVILDVRARDAFRLNGRKGSINIPTDELDARAVRELGSKPLVIDCADLSKRMCLQAAGRLRQLGFRDLAVFIR